MDVYYDKETTKIKIDSYSTNNFLSISSEILCRKISTILEKNGLDFMNDTFIKYLNGKNEHLVDITSCKNNFYEKFVNNPIHISSTIDKILNVIDGFLRSSFIYLNELLIVDKRNDQLHFLLRNFQPEVHALKRNINHFNRNKIYFSDDNLKISKHDVYKQLFYSKHMLGTLVENLDKRHMLCKSKSSVDVSLELYIKNAVTFFDLIFKTPFFSMIRYIQYNCNGDISVDVSNIADIPNNKELIPEFRKKLMLCKFFTEISEVDNSILNFLNLRTEAYICSSIADRHQFSCLEYIAIDYMWKKYDSDKGRIVLP